MRRPLVCLLAATALLLGLALPVLAIDTGVSGLSTLPDRFPSKQGFDALSRDFPGASVDPAQIVIQGDVASAPVRAAIERLEGSLAGEAAFGPSTQQVAAGGDVVVLSVPVAGDADGAEAVSAIRDLRADLIPQAFGGVDATVLVGGTTAENADYFDIVGSWLPIVFAFVLGLSFILLTVAFRSIVIPAIAIALNLLAVGAAYGLLVLVFQKGVGNELFGFQQIDAVEAWVPLFLFSVLFGLSMDYQVFLLSRIKERYSQTGDTAGAVAFGVGSTARLITGAALIIIAVFSGFAAGDLVMFQQMGFGVAVALLVDATIVRCVLVPASMKLLGDRNWYLPVVAPLGARRQRRGPHTTGSAGRRLTAADRADQLLMPPHTQREGDVMSSLSHTTPVAVTSAPARPLVWAWPLAILVGYPIGGLLANVIVGHVDSVGAALAGGLIAGAVIGTAQWLALQPLVPWLWAAATSVGMAIGLAAGSGLVDYGTERGDVVLMGAVTGLAVGGLQAIVLARSGVAGAVWWAVANPPAWALGWLVTSYVITSNVDEQFTNFGAGGALLFAVLTGLLLARLIRRTPPERHVG